MSERRRSVHTRVICLVLLVAVPAALVTGTSAGARAGRLRSCAPRNALVVKAGRLGIAYLLLDRHGRTKRPSTLYGCLRPSGRRYTLSFPQDNNRPLPPPAIAFNGALIVTAVADSTDSFGTVEVDLRTGKRIARLIDSGVPGSIVIKADGAFAYTDCLGTGDRVVKGFDYGACGERPPVPVVVVDHQPGSDKIDVGDPQPGIETDRRSSLRLDRGGATVSWLYKGKRHSFPIR